MLKKLKIISSLLLITIILWNITVFAGEDITKCIGKTNYELYQCQFTNICKIEKYWLNLNKVVKLDKEKWWYYEKDISRTTLEKEGYVFFDREELDWEELYRDEYKNLSDLDKIKYLYTKNQNKIYKCAVINSQLLAFIKVKKLLNSTDKTGILKERLVHKLDLKKKKLEKKIKENKCNTIKTNWEKKAIKKIVLDQSTLELCNYRYYLWYLYSKSKWDLTNVLWGEKVLSASSIEKVKNEQQNEILNEIKHSFKMYPLAFDTYIQYDSFLQLHIILELLKEDYRVFRDKLYLTLRPINQVVYKIINAQSK
jgi:hypothetical protein